jgi:hypothetical protein
LAQPKLADIAWKAASPLQKYTVKFSYTRSIYIYYRAFGIVELITMSDPLYIFMKISPMGAEFLNVDGWRNIFAVL